MIKRLYIDNYKSLVNFELPLRELTLLLGPNGVGKTSVLDVVFAVRLLLSGQAKVTDDKADGKVFPTPTLTRWQKRNKQVFELDVVLEGDDLRYRIEVDHDRKQKKARISLERLESCGKPLFVFEMGQVQLFKDSHEPGPTFRGDWTESALARVQPVDTNTRLTRFLKLMQDCGVRPVSGQFCCGGFERGSRVGAGARNFAAWYRHVLQERQELVRNSPGAAGSHRRLSRDSHGESGARHPRLDGDV